MDGWRHPDRKKGYDLVSEGREREREREFREILERRIL